MHFTAVHDKLYKTGETKGKNDDEVSKELIQLLRVMEYTNTVDEVDLDERLKKLHRNVKSLQQNEEVSVKYMQLWEEMEYERREAREEGHSEGRAEGNEEGMVRYAALTEILFEEDDIVALKRIAKDIEYRNELLKKYNL